MRTQRCPRCHDSHVVDIKLTLGGSRLTMHSCSGCECRWWDEEGKPVGLREVLTLAR
jgi:uncharacterized protein YodC (DUF2158 family)